MPFLLGLTGNIGCGKSTIGQHLSRRYAAEYIDADRLVHALYAPGSPETHAIAQRFAPELLQPDGAIDRRRLGDIVLRDPDAMRQLEALLDPGVLQAISDRLRQTTAAVVALDAIRLIESGLRQRCDTIWVVVCDQSAQLERLLSRGFTPEQARLYPLPVMWRSVGEAGDAARSRRRCAISAKPRRSSRWASGS